MNNQEEWFAVIADQDVFDAQGKLDYPKGSVVSYGSVVAEKAHLDKKGLRAVSIGHEAPNFEIHQWNAKTEKLEPRGGS